MQKIILIVIFLLLISGRMSFAEETLVMGVVTDESERTFRIAENLLQEISKKMGVEIKLTSLPAKRAIVSLKNGKIHGEFSRIASYQDSVPGAIKVKEPITSLPLHVYTVSQNFKVNGWDSLEPYSIVTVRGYSFVDNYLRDHKTYAVGSAKFAFGFLKAERADLFISDHLTASSILDSPDFDSESIKKLEPPVTVLNTYTFFSPKHPDFVESYHKALVEVKEEGVYQRIITETK